MIGAVIAAWLDTRTHPLRTVSALLGMVAAVAAVVVVDSANVLSDRASQEFLARQYGRAATIEFVATQTPTSLDTADEDNRRLVKTMRSNGFPEVAYYLANQVVLYRGDRSTQVTGALTQPSFSKIHVISSVSGELPRETADSRVPHATIDVPTAAMLGLTPRSAVGVQLQYAVKTGAEAPDRRYALTEPFIVDGVTNPDPNQTFGASALFFSTKMTATWLARGTLYWFSHVRPVEAARAENTVGALTEPGDSDTQSFSPSRIDIDDSIGPILKQQHLTSRAVSIVALLVGGFGIFAVGMSTTRELRRVYALRRALGAQRVTIFSSVLIESMLRALLAGALAICLASVIVSMYRRDLVLSSLPLPQSTSLPASSALTGLASALLVGLAAGLLPAISAARGNLVQALRD